MNDPLSVRSQLCETCSTIDFPSYFQPPAQGENSSENAVGRVIFKEKALGIRAEIRRKGIHCGFCYLAYEATNAAGDDTTISMSSIFCGSNRDIDGKDMVPTYYIRLISDSRGALTTGYIQLLADDAHLLRLSRDFLARVSRVAGFDMAQARRWLDTCRTEHGSQCSTLSGDLDEELPPPQPVDLLAIDLVNNSICAMPQGSDYVALSYCWPAKEYLTLKQFNRKALFEPGALLRNLDKLPGTVQDAIKCAQELPFQYLWIDALCIVQDNNDHKDKQLRQMDRVYSCAALTLVCACPVARGSNDPCDGFPGLDNDNAARDRSVRLVKGLRMMVVSLCVDDYLRSTRWWTRCW